MRKIIKLLLMMCVLVSEANAVGIPRAVGGEARIKIVNYMPNTVYKFVGHYLYQSIIEFAPGEEIQTISMGTPTPWQVVPAGNRIFVKPIEDDASTNMTVITNKRMYFFEMHAEDAMGVADNRLAFVLKFIYPDDVAYSSVTHISQFQGPDLSKPEAYNFKYAIAGKAKNIEPKLVFDDGEFTYMKFNEINAELPAVFLVKEGGQEELVNYRIAHGYLIIERVANRFTLRHGSDILCVYNEKEDS
jgi:type IV secretion system protein VirB9